MHRDSNENKAHAVQKLSNINSTKKISTVTLITLRRKSVQLHLHFLQHRSKKNDGKFTDRAREGTDEVHSFALRQRPKKPNPKLKQTILPEPPKKQRHFQKNIEVKAHTNP